MPEVVFAIPGDLATPTGGYVYARRMLALLPEHGIPVRHLPLPASFPDPSADDLVVTERLLRALPKRAVLLADGLAYGAMPERLIASLDRPIVALVHHPLAFETGLTEARRAELHACEAAALAAAQSVITTSAATARLLAEAFDVPRHRITVAEPGTAPALRAQGTGKPVELIAVGAVSPRKGYEPLVAALDGLSGLAWRATIVGALDRAPATVAAVRAAIAAAGLADRITLAGAVDQATLRALYARADLFVSPSLFEGYGMALAEAMAHGLPLVAALGGAVGDTVPDAAAAKVPPGDVPALRAALARMIAEPALRRACAEAAWQAGQALPRWGDTAARIVRVMREIAR